MFGKPLQFKTGLSPTGFSEDSGKEHGSGMLHIYFHLYVHSNNIPFRLKVHDVADFSSSAIAREEHLSSVYCLWQVAENEWRQTGYAA